MSGHVMIFAPVPQLAVTIERRGNSEEIHLHAGGQGVWQARMIKTFGVPVVICAAFGGEVGLVLEPVIAAEGIGVRAVHGQSANGTYVQDRRDGVRVDVAEVAGDPLSRHELDELYGMALSEGLTAEVCLLSGAPDPAVVPPDMYRRLATDLGRNGQRVIADLSGDHLDAVLSGRPHVVKVSHDDVGASGDLGSLIGVACRLRQAGANTVVVTRAERTAAALIGDTVYEVVVPRLEAADPRGAGDSLTAGLAAALAAGAASAEAVRAGAAAGALNVTRHGLGTGEQAGVGQLRERVRLVPVGNVGPDGRGSLEAPDVRTSTEELAQRVELP